MLRPLMVKPVTSIEQLEDRAFTPFTFSNWEGEIAYRVFAPLRTPEEEKTIRNLFPQSFAREYRQNSVLQVGLYQDYNNAEQVLSTLRSMNIVAFIVEP
ncbi:MAG: hypothetical protein HC796_08870 [Synechococcaceae cyanobacterium RL_1_2]|nr:hypothetical protein [Synechococcaceae cyanobacterium RL_1_2]